MCVWVGVRKVNEPGRVSDYLSGQLDSCLTQESRSAGSPDRACMTVGTASFTCERMYPINVYGIFTYVCMYAAPATVVLFQEEVLVVPATVGR